jgi:acetoin utilization protein AcuC
MQPKLYFHPRMLSYSFGPNHPFKPERLQRAVAMIEAIHDINIVDPGPGDRDDPLRVHDEDYVRAVASFQTGMEAHQALLAFGFWPGDNPPFAGMYEAALAFTAGTTAAARAVRDGAALGVSLGGGLHHARRREASGFCIFNDPAMAISILRERFDRVAYIDIDLHHGDGVQWIWYEDPSVLTCSIHESGRTLYPGTGFPQERGPAFTSVNVPLAAGTTGDVWLWALRNAILPAIERFRPQAIVLEMGADPHFSDPLGHLAIASQEWLEAVSLVRDQGVPLVACGGGGYNMDSVVRMWVAAFLTLHNLPLPIEIPSANRVPGGSSTFYDSVLPQPRDSGRDEAEAVVRYLESEVLPFVPPGRG